LSYIFGIDLSGPTNVRDTAVACFRAVDQELVHEFTRTGTDDEAIRELVALVGLGSDETVTVGIDAPLSYQLGGGDRPADGALRRRLRESGFPGATVMPPTLTRMAFLTLRGIALARVISLEVPLARIVEVHPIAAMALRGAPVAALRACKRSDAARQALGRWLRGRGLRKVPRGPASDHVIAAYAAALAAWDWQGGRSAWIARAATPHHPYDFAC